LSKGELFALLPNYSNKEERFFMTNNRTKRQHTVPQVYLRNFANSESQITIANLSNKKIFPTNITNASVVDKFYNVYMKDEAGQYVSPLRYETWLSKMEDQISPVFKKIVNDKAWPLNETDRWILSKFISLQFIRGQDKRDIRDAVDSYVSQARLALDGRDAFLANVSSISEKKRLEEEWKMMESGSLEIKHSSTNHTLTFLEEINTYIPSIHRRIWYLYHFDDLKLLSCDNPVVIIRSENSSKAATIDDVSGIDDSPCLFYPISREMGLLMIHPFYTLNYDVSDMIINQKQMPDPKRSHEYFNSEIVKMAHKEIYCHPEDTLLIPNPLPSPASLKINGPTFSQWIEAGNYLRKGNAGTG
jgi:hypothetical protein